MTRLGAHNTRKLTDTFNCLSNHGLHNHCVYRMRAIIECVEARGSNKRKPKRVLTATQAGHAPSNRNSPRKRDGCLPSRPDPRG